MEPNFSWVFQSEVAPAASALTVAAAFVVAWLPHLIAGTAAYLCLCAFLRRRQ